MSVVLQPLTQGDDADRRSRFVEALFETMSNGVVFSRAVFNAQGELTDFQVVDCNEAVCRMTGFSRDDMRVRSMRQQDPEADQSGVFARWKHAYLSGEPTRFVHYFSGAGAWLEQSLNRFEDGIIACFTDITHLKRNEAERDRQADLLEQIGRAGQMAVVVMEAVRQEGVIVDFRYTFCNQQAASWLNRSAAEVVGSLLNETSQSPDHDQLFALQKQVVDTGKTMAYDVLMPGNRTYYTVYNQLNDGIFITAIDVTQARRIATRHERLNQTLQKQNDLLATVLSQVRSGVVVHDAVTDGQGQVIDFRLRLQNDFMRDLRWQAYRESMSPGDSYQERLRRNPAAQPLYDWMVLAYASNQPQQIEATSPLGIALNITCTRLGESVLMTTSEGR